MGDPNDIPGIRKSVDDDDDDDTWKSLKQAAAHRKCLWFADNLVATCTGDPVVQPRNYCRWYQQFRHLEGIGSQQGDLIDR